MSFAGKSVVVTGSASGLGKAIAKAFVEAGANVTICDVNKSSLDATLAELNTGDASGKVIAVEGNITSEQSMQNVFEQAKQHGNGTLNILVNNAGVMDAFEPVGEVSRETWDRVIGVNLTGTFLTTKLAVNMMLAQIPAGGAILNVGSAGSVKGGVAGAAYVASKHALLGLTKNTAAFYAKKGIRCNAILPGGMETNIMSSIPNATTGGIKEENYKVIASTMAMQPERCSLADMSNLVLAMCGDHGQVLNGACVPADCGWLAY